MKGSLQLPLDRLQQSVQLRVRAVGQHEVICDLNDRRQHFGHVSSRVLGMDQILQRDLDRHLAEQVPVVIAGGDRWWRNVGHEVEIGVAPEPASARHTTNSVSCARLRMCSTASMTRDEVKAFVDAMIEAGSNIQAIGTVGYVLAEPVDLDDGEAYARIELVSEAFGERDHLKEDIIAYLHEIGRVVEVRKEPDTGLV